MVGGLRVRVVLIDKIIGHNKMRLHKLRALRLKDIMLLSVVMFSLLAAASAQQSPYDVPDPGVLPQYLPTGEPDNRFGGDSNTVSQNTQMHAGTLNTKAMYNQVSEWPEDRKPFWYLNAAAIQKEREQQQEQQQQQQQQQRQQQSSQQSMRNKSSFSRRFSSSR